jgi:hypothetical protein
MRFTTSRDHWQGRGPDCNHFGGRPAADYFTETMTLYKTEGNIEWEHTELE